jgi:hypothetical protein
VVLAPVRPAFRLGIERELQGSQHAITVCHDLFIGKANDPKTELLQHLAIAPQIGFAIMGVAIDFNGQPFCRTEEIDDAEADHILAAEFVPKALPSAKRLPQAFFRFGWIVSHCFCALEQDFAGDATTPNPLL